MAASLSFDALDLILGALCVIAPLAAAIVHRQILPGILAAIGCVLASAFGGLITAAPAGILGVLVVAFWRHWVWVSGPEHQRRTPAGDLADPQDILVEQQNYWRVITLTVVLLSLAMALCSILLLTSLWDMSGTFARIVQTHPNWQQGKLSGQGLRDRLKSDTRAAISRASQLQDRLAKAKLMPADQEKAFAAAEADMKAASQKTDEQAAALEKAQNEIHSLGGEIIKLHRELGDTRLDEAPNAQETNLPSFRLRGLRTARVEGLLGGQFSPDGRSAAGLNSRPGEWSLELWDVGPWRRIARVALKKNAGYRQVAWIGSRIVLLRAAATAEGDVLPDYERVQANEARPTQTQHLDLYDADALRVASEGAALAPVASHVIGVDVRKFRVAPDGKKLFILAASARCVVVFDLEKQAVERSIPCGDAHDLDLSPSGQTLFVLQPLGLASAAIDAGEFQPFGPRADRHHAILKIAAESDGSAIACHDNGLLRITARGATDLRAVIQGRPFAVAHYERPRMLLAVSRKAAFSHRLIATGKGPNGLDELMFGDWPGRYDDEDDPLALSISLSPDRQWLLFGAGRAVRLERPTE